MLLGKYSRTYSAQMKCPFHKRKLRTQHNTGNNNTSISYWRACRCGARATITISYLDNQSCTLVTALQLLRASLFFVFHDLEYNVVILQIYSKFLRNILLNSEIKYPSHFPLIATFYCIFIHFNCVF